MSDKQYTNTVLINFHVEDIFLSISPNVHLIVESDTTLHPEVSVAKPSLFFSMSDTFNQLQKQKQLSTEMTWNRHFSVSVWFRYGL